MKSVMGPARPRPTWPTDPRSASPATTGSSLNRHHHHHHHHHHQPGTAAADALTDGYSTGVAIAWLVSIQAADRHPPPARAGHLLNLLSVLDSNGTPLNLL